MPILDSLSDGASQALIDFSRNTDRIVVLENTDKDITTELNKNNNNDGVVDNFKQGEQKMEAVAAAAVAVDEINGVACIVCDVSGINKFNKNKCRFEGCKDTVRESNSATAEDDKLYCKKHTSGSRQCEFEPCDKCAQGSTKFCIKHGGGRRCTVEGCNKGARDKNFCAGHGMYHVKHFVIISNVVILCILSRLILYK